MGEAHENTCVSVTWDMRDDSYGDHAWWTATVGDLLWNPKMPEGHVLVAEVRCGDKHNGRTVDLWLRWLGPESVPVDHDGL